MNQLTFSVIEYSNRRKKTKREEFLDAMEEIIPWTYWVDIIRPYYYTNKRGRKPIGIETMLRMYLMQIWFNLSDEGIEDSIYDSYAMRSFMHIDFTQQQVPQPLCFISGICLRQIKLARKYLLMSISGSTMPGL